MADRTLTYSLSITVAADGDTDNLVTPLSDTHTGQILDGDLTLSAGATDVAVPFGTITSAKLIYISSNKKLTMKVNGGSSSTPVDVVFLKETTGITSVTLTNTETSAASVTFLVAG